MGQDDVKKPPPPLESIPSIYVSCVAGHHVTRYGTHTLIGARPDPTAEGNLTFDEAMIVRIPAPEYAAYRREYDELLAEGALLSRTVEEYDAYQADREAALDAAAAAAAPELEPGADPGEAPPASVPLSDTAGGNE